MGLFGNIQPKIGNGQWGQTYGVLSTGYVYSLCAPLLFGSEHVRCSVLCPAYVPTGIANSERNRPYSLREERTKSEGELRMEENLKQAVESGKISAAQVADQVLQSIREKHFYILTHSKIKPAIETRFQDILLERPPIDTSKR